MYPAYPHHTNPIHYAPNVNPTAKETDRGTLNLPYYPWPYSSNHCYPVPQGCHSCCNHSYFGGPYSFTPHYQPPPPFPTHGFYPPFPGAHHPAYSFPPPHYSVEQPRYDYDKNTPATPHRCCGCENKSAFKPQEPEIVKKPNESLVPFLKDCPYPVMWLPSTYMNTESNANGKEKEDYSHDPVLKPLDLSKQGENDERAHDRQGEVGINRFPFPIFWLPSKNNEVKKDMNEEKLDEKTKNEEAESEKSSKTGVQKVIPVKQLGAKDQEKSSSQKTTSTSKIPPVCLRIDPLPKKKSSSRPPSPSGDKKRSKVSTIEDSKAVEQQTKSSEEGLKNDSKKVEKDNVVDEGSKMEKRTKLSESEAVLKIQAVYRGFEVRKSQPLMKLRQIGEVGKQVVELRNRIQDLQASIDGKQKLVIGESIMSLLLKLDTIQGLHPVVRDVRKSVAKELVGLQEKLDSLTIVKESETQSKQTTSADGDQTLTQPNSDEQASEPLNNDIAEADNINLQPQLELQNEDNTGELNNDQMELDRPVDHDEKAQSDSNDEAVRLDLDDHEVEAADPVHDMQPEHLVEQTSVELNNNEVKMMVETEQPVDDVIQEKSDQAQPESDVGVETMNSDECELDGDINLEPQVESKVKQSISEITGDQSETVEEIEPLVAVEKSDQREALILENVDSMEVAGGEKQSLVELSGDQLEMVEEIEPPVEEETSDQREALTLENVDGGGEKQNIVEFAGDQHAKVEEIEPPMGEEKSDQRKALILDNVDSMEEPTTTTVEIEPDIGAVETMELGKEDVDPKEAPAVDDVKEVLMEDLEGAPAGSHVSSGGDMKLMEENEKLRVALEELMKAGNKQVSVIKELTGRVKDLEKKLSKRKRKVKRSSKRPRGSLVEEVRGV